MSFPKCEVFVDVIERREDDYHELNEDFEEVRGFIEIEVRDENCKLLQKGKHEMHSFLNNFLKMIEGFARAPGGASTGVSLIGTGGSAVTVYAEWYGGSADTVGGGTPMACRGGDNDASKGILVGSGTSPVTLNDYNLASQIPHGTGAGQLDYDAMAIDDLGIDTSVTPPVYRIRMIRPFKNVSGGAITVNEVGIMARNYYASSAGVRVNTPYYIARDVLPRDYIVPNGGSITITIIIEVVLG